MHLPRAYIETSVPSFYFETRTSPEIVSRRNWSRKWWALAKDRFELVTSNAVLQELGAGILHKAAERLRLVESLPLLPANEAIIDIVKTYIRHKVMPSNPSGDALHLALASYHKCDFLVTWNCNHIANANKFGHIRRINTMLGLFVPSLVTPLELIGDSDETSD